MHKVKAQRLLAGAAMESSHSEAIGAADDGTQAMQTVLDAEASACVSRPHEGRSIALPLPAVSHKSRSWHLCSYLLCIQVTQQFGIDARQAPSSLFA